MVLYVVFPHVQQVLLKLPSLPSIAHHVEVIERVECRNSPGKQITKGALSSRFESFIILELSDLNWGEFYIPTQKFSSQMTILDRRVWKKKLHFLSKVSARW